MRAVVLHPVKQLLTRHWFQKAIAFGGSRGQFYMTTIRKLKLMTLPLQEQLLKKALDIFMTNVYNRVNTICYSSGYVKFIIGGDGVSQSP